MPELPDLVHIVKVLEPALAGKAIAGARVKEPIVLRLLVPGYFGDLVSGRTIQGPERHGPFLRFSLGLGPGPGLELIMHLMLAGRLRLAARDERPLAHTAFALDLDSGQCLSYGDEKNMGKVYLCEPAQAASIPGYATQGVDVMGETFTYELFSSLISGRRCQARVFLMDQAALSAIGNAYADEILFEAGIHPKATASSLPEPKRRALYEGIRSVLAWGIREVEAAGKPLEEKARGHLRVRGRAGQACPRCGATIRKAGVLGFDAFFCPVCQPDTAHKGLDWNRLPG